MDIINWIKTNCKSIEGKTICITGSTGGLATKFTDILAGLGANFIFANRDKQKSEKQKQDLINKYPNIKIKIMLVDMLDMNSVKLFICKLKQIHIDVLILNSAIYNKPRKKSRADFDNIFQVNFVSPYYIAKQMLTSLRKVKDSKVIVIGSIAYNYSKLDFEDIQKLKTSKQNIIYGNSKRMLMFSLQKLFLDQPIDFSIVHPGVTLTKMTNHYHWSINWLTKLGIKLFFPNPEKACLCVPYSLFNSTNEGEWIGPKKHNIWGYPKVQKLPNYPQKEAEKAFDTAENIYKSLSQ